MNLQAASTWFKEHWFKMGVLVALLGASWALYDGLVLQPQIAREAEAKKNSIQQEEKVQAQIDAQQTAAETKKWDDLKTQVGDSKKATENVSSAVQETYDSNRNWLNGAYAKQSNPYYSYLLPLVTATEHYQKTLQSYMNSLVALDNIRFKMLAAISNQDSVTLDSLAGEESAAVGNMSYWTQQQQSEDVSVKAVQTQVIKNIGSQNSGY